MLLQRHFINKFGTQYRKPIRGLTHRAQIALAQHAWPGNVRELENALGHASMMVMSDTIDVQDLPEYLRALAANWAPGSESTKQVVPIPTDVGALEIHERQLVVRAMETAGGNQSEAARLLRIGRDALRYKLKKHNLQI